MRPVPHAISTPYGYVPGYPLNFGQHFGLDYDCPIGTPGTVRYSGRVVIARADWPDIWTAQQFNVYPKAWGLTLSIDIGRGYTEDYCHLSKITVSEGEWVEPGQNCYETGESGLTFGAHLHLQVRYQGRRIDPALTFTL